MSTVSTCWFLQHCCSRTKNNSLQLKGSLGEGPKPKEQSISKRNLKIMLFLCFRDSYLPSAGIKAVYHIPSFSKLNFLKRSKVTNQWHTLQCIPRKCRHTTLCQSLWVIGSIQFTHLRASILACSIYGEKLLLIKTLSYGQKYVKKKTQKT